MTVGWRSRIVWVTHDEKQNDYLIGLVKVGDGDGSWKTFNTLSSNDFNTKRRMHMWSSRECRKSLILSSAPAKMSLSTPAYSIWILFNDSAAGLREKPFEHWLKVCSQRWE